MERGAGMLKASISLILLLNGIASTVAAAVSHGDLLMLGLDRPTGLATVLFYSPTGKLKATVILKSMNCGAYIWAHTVSQDGRYAAIGCQGDPPFTQQVVFLQVIGASPKVLGAKVLPGINPGVTDFESCYQVAGTYVETSPLALKSRPLAGGAGAVLDVYLSTLCPAAKPLIGCDDEGVEGSTVAAAIQHWTVVHTKSLKTLGPIIGGDRAVFSEKTRCGAVGLSVAVTTNGKAYAAFGFNVAKGLHRSLDGTIGIFEVQRSSRQGTRLIPTWRFQTRPLSIGLLKFLVTGPVTGCAIGYKTTAIALANFYDTRIYSFAKGRAPYIGGSICRGTDFDFDLPYGDISCKGSRMYATVNNLTYDATTNRVLKVSNKELRKGGTGRVVFETPIVSFGTAISIIP